MSNKNIAIFSLHTCVMKTPVEKLIPIEICAVALRNPGLEFKSFITPSKGISYKKIPNIVEESTRLIMSKIGWSPGSDYPYLDECLKALSTFIRVRGITHLFAHRGSSFDEQVLKGAYTLCGLNAPNVQFVDTLPLLRHESNSGKRSIRELCNIHLPGENFSFTSALSYCHALRLLLTEFEYQGLINLDDTDEDNSFESKYSPAKDKSDNKWVKQFLDADADNNGFISQEEFKNWHASRAENLFKLADLNGDGILSKSEFKGMFNNLPDNGM